VTDGGVEGVGVAFLFALGASLFFAKVAILIGCRSGMVVKPRLFGRGGTEVSYLGGVALAVSTGVAILLSEGPRHETAVVLTGGFVLLVFGLADDSLPSKGLTPAIRIVVEAVVAFLVCATALHPNLTGNRGLDLALAVFVLVATTNAFNLLDNMDGVAGTTGAAVAIGLIGLAVLQGQYFVAALASAAVGGCIGFLRHNLRRPQLYLGNGGSLFLGFMLAAGALHLRFPLARPWGLVAVIAVLAVPATDTSLVVLSRMLAHRPVFEGGVDHLSHRLASLGFPSHVAALMHAAGCGLGALAAMIAVHLRTATPVVAIIVWFAICTLALLGMTVYDPVPEPTNLGQGGTTESRPSAAKPALEEGSA
jgi:UDP-GlcNAc:undecaprenyl-phosphate GlcNAc-1-phosphate transferase